MSHREAQAMSLLLYWTLKVNLTLLGATETIEEQYGTHTHSPFLVNSMTWGSSLEDRAHEFLVGSLMTIESLAMLWGSTSNPTIRNTVTSRLYDAVQSQRFHV